MKEEIKVLQAEDLKKQYGKVYEINLEIQPEETDKEVELKYFFKEPSPMSFNRYIKSASKNTMKAFEGLIIDNVVEEQLEDVKEKIKLYPAISFSLGEQLLAMLGLAKTANFKKL